MTQFPEIHFKKCIRSGAKIDWFEVTEECKCPGGIIIPVGYITDFASIPRFLWSVFPPHGFMTNAAILHDYMYDNKVGENIWGEYQARITADDLFLVECIKEAVPVWQAVLIYYVLRLFGRSWWVK